MDEDTYDPHALFDADQNPDPLVYNLPSFAPYKQQDPGDVLKANVIHDCELNVWILLTRPEWDISIRSGLLIRLFDVHNVFLYEVEIRQRYSWDKHYIIFAMRDLHAEYEGCMWDGIAVPHPWAWITIDEQISWRADLPELPDLYRQELDRLIEYDADDLYDIYPYSDKLSPYTPLWDRKPRITRSLPNLHLQYESESPLATAGDRTEVMIQVEFAQEDEEWVQAELEGEVVVEGQGLRAEHASSATGDSSSFSCIIS